MGAKNQKFVICYLEHCYRYIEVEAQTAKLAREKFEQREDIDWGSSWDYGDFDDETFVSVMKFDKNGDLVDADK